MELITLTQGLFDSNCYILADKQECAIIDCGVESRRVLEAVRKKGLTVRYIILTHGHLDHIHHVAAIQRDTGAELCLHEEELLLYSHNEYNGYAQFGFIPPNDHPEPQRLLKDGERLPLGDGFLGILHTPGHSPGSISILAVKMVFTGDTLFARGVGRTDLYGGSGQKLQESIKGRLYTLEKDCVVYPGHGGATTIGYERENNPYV